MDKTLEKKVEEMAKSNADIRAELEALKAEKSQAEEKAEETEAEEKAEEKEAEEKEAEEQKVFFFFLSKSLIFLRKL